MGKEKVEKFTVHSLQFTVYSSQFTVHSLQYIPDLIGIHLNYHQKRRIAPTLRQKKANISSTRYDDERSEVENKTINNIRNKNAK